MVVSWAVGDAHLSKGSTKSSTAVGLELIATLLSWRYRSLMTLMARGKSTGLCRKMPGTEHRLSTRCHGNTDDYYTHNNCSQ